METVRSIHSFGYVRRPIRPSKSTFEGPLHNCVRACGVEYAKAPVPLPLDGPLEMDCGHSTRLGRDFAGDCGERVREGRFKAEFRCRSLCVMLCFVESGLGVCVCGGGGGGLWCRGREKPPSAGEGTRACRGCGCGMQVRRWHITPGDLCIGGGDVGEKCNLKPLRP